MHYRKDIQGLRALAVLFVFIFHLNPQWLPGGFIGVDVFFVISGFLVGGIILHKVDNKNFSFIDFYIARVKRIVPAYYFMLLCTAIATTIILVGEYDVETFKRTLKHAIVFNADYCFASMNSYFGLYLHQNPLLHAWTIATEMKFYLLLPLLLFFTKKKYLPHVLTAITVILLFYSVYQIQYIHNRTIAYYSLPVRIPEFLMGVFVAVLANRFSQLASAIKVTAGLSGIAIILLCAVFFNHTTAFPGIYAMLPCGGAALLLFSNVGPVSALLSKKPFVAVGAVSYSVYLWHWPVMALLRYYYDTDTFTNIQMLIVVAFTVLCSIVSYVFIEQKFRGGKLKPLVFSVVPATALLVAICVYARPVNSYFSPIPAEYSGPVFGMKSHNTDFVETLGDTLTKPQIFLTGNSHALALKAYFDYIGKRQHFSFRTLTSNTYIPIDGVDSNEARKKRYSDFILAEQLVPVAQKEIAKSKVIIIVSSTFSYVPSMVTAIEKLIVNLKEGQQLVLVGTFPMLDKDPLKVNRDFIKNRNIEQYYKVKFKDPNTYIMQFVKKYPNVHYFDLSKGSTYNNAPFYNDTVMYYDRKHLNKFGATVLAKHTESNFMELLNALPN